MKREKLELSVTKAWENSAIAEDWDSRQSCIARLILSFRIADVRKVGLNSAYLTRKLIAKREQKKQPVDPGYI